MVLLAEKIPVMVLCLKYSKAITRISNGNAMAIMKKKNMRVSQANRGSPPLHNACTMDQLMNEMVREEWISISPSFFP